MCGRFALATEKHILELLFELDQLPDFELKPRYNIAPSQQVPIVRLSPADHRREMTELKWGLVPFWSKDESIGSRLINARAETASQKPAFRDAYQKRRLLVPASGFYERKKEDSGKQPYYITGKESGLIALAGLWESWGKEPNMIETFTILTTEPNNLIAELHNRMPVIISPQDFQVWLDLETGGEELKDLLKPYPDELLKAYPVSRLVNKPANDMPDLIKPL